MNVAGNSEMMTNANVVPLFSTVEIETIDVSDPLAQLLEEGRLEEDRPEEVKAPKANQVLVSTQQFPDQSMFVLEQQLDALKVSLSRLKFYLSDMDDLLPR